MKKENLYLSTIASDAVHMAKEYGIHLEIAEYCTAWNMDEKFGGVDQVVRKKLDGISQSVLHSFLIHLPRNSNSSNTGNGGGSW